MCGGGRGRGNNLIITDRIPEDAEGYVFTVSSQGGGGWPPPLSKDTLPHPSPPILTCPPCPTTDTLHSPFHPSPPILTPTHPRLPPAMSTPHNPIQCYTVVGTPLAVTREDCLVDAFFPFLRTYPIFQTQKHLHNQTTEMRDCLILFVQ